MEALTAAAPPKYRAKPKTLYQQLQEKYRRERQEGIKEGIQEGIREGIQISIANGTDLSLVFSIKKVMFNFPTATDAQIATMFELPLERIQQLRAELKSEQPEQGAA